MSTIMGLFSFAVFIVLIVDMITGMVDSIKCLSNPSQTCQITCTFIIYLVLAENPVLRARFFNALPGGVVVFMIYKWVVLGVVSLYVIPILVYAIFYCKC